MSNNEPKYGERRWTPDHADRIEPIPVEPTENPWTPGAVTGALIILGVFAVPIIFGIRWALGAL